MKGLYFYKLVSPYSEDVTKDCKLTVNEIDHNFITLKDVDIKNAHFDEADKTLVIERNDGDTIDVDLSSMVDGITTNLDIDYDSVAGTITITYNDKRAVIDGLITRDNLSKDVLTEVISNGTLQGKGNSGSPIGLSPVEQTGTYKPAIRLINLANGEYMPKPHHLIRGDRYVTFENVSEYGYLYDFRSVKRMNEDLCNGWRIPTKSDWDNMLNAIEPCDEYRNHNSIMGNQVLGKLAGKLLKSRDKWDIVDSYLDDKGTHACQSKDNEQETDSAFDVDIADCECDCGCSGSTAPIRPIKPKRITPNGVDAYGMKILPAGYGDGCQIMDYFGKRGAFWSSTMSHVTDVYIKRFDYNKAGVVQSIESPNSLFSIRLVKDFNGSNHQEVEFINGVNYSTKLLPSLNTEFGYSVWTAMNATFTNEKYRPIEPNGGIGLTYKKTYYINEWDGFDWVKKEMSEGDSIVLLNGLDKDKNIEYRIVNGTLVGVNKIVYDNVMDTIQPEIDRIDGELTDLRDRVTITEERIDDLENCTEKLHEKLAQEIEDRIEGDTQLWDGLNEETTNREHVDNEQWKAINQEAAIREQTDTQLWEGINGEITAREDVDKQLWTAINNESAIREQIDNEQWDAIVKEGQIREKIDNEQWDAINIERTTREEGDILLNKRVDDEIIAREEADSVLDDKIDNEIIAREEGDKILNDKIDDALSEHDKDFKELKDLIELEAIIREQKDDILHKEIVDEAIARENVDTQLWAGINAEAAAREDVDKQLWTAINNESAAREDVDKQLWTAINNESAIREEGDALLNKRVDDEILRATTKEQYLEDRVITEAGSSFDCDKGTLTLETKNPDNKITITLTGNYGTF